MTRARRRGDAQRPTLLLVDDERLITRLMARLLSHAGFDCVECHDGAVALQLLQQRHFDAVVSDMAMPKLTGMQLLAALRNLGLDVPVIIVSGDTSSEGAYEAKGLGAFDYLCKPISFEQLLNATRGAVAVLCGGSPAATRRPSTKLRAPCAERE